MTFSLSKKDLVYVVIIAILTIALSASFLVYRAGAQDVTTSLISEQTNTNTDEVNQTDLLELGSEGGPQELNIPHLTCDSQVNFTTLPTSTTYNEGTSYDHAFMGGGNHVQDVNGDNLPDYIYNYHNLIGSGDQITAELKSCTYLNNGDGWERVYICYAKTTSNYTTGQVTFREYRGDCAADPEVSN